MKGQKGFTLLELLISITLIAVLVVVLSMALRSGITAYTRSKDYNRFYLPETALFGLLWRQMEAVVSPEDPYLASYSRLRGEKDSLSFVTTYVPQGMSEGGIFQVVYYYNQDKKSILYAQKIITMRKDIETKPIDQLERLSKEDLAENGWLVEEMADIEDFLFAYKPSNADTETKPEDWDETFNKRQHLPTAIAFKLKFKDQADQATRWQIIPVGLK